MYGESPTLPPYVAVGEVQDFCLWQNVARAARFLVSDRRSLTPGSPLAYASHTQRLTWLEKPSVGQMSFWQARLGGRLAISKDFLSNYVNSAIIEEIVAVFMGNGGTSFLSCLVRYLT